LNSENECEADVGNPPGYLVIEVRNDDSAIYEINIIIKCSMATPINTLTNHEMFSYYY
jgi:hypothetical protein